MGDPLGANGGRDSEHQALGVQGAWPVLGQWTMQVDELELWEGECHRCVGGGGLKDQRAREGTIQSEVSSWVYALPVSQW